VRLLAPFDWRIAAYQREQIVDRRCAEKALKRDDQRQRAWVKSLYHVDIEDARLFSLVLDASRFTPEPLLQTLLAAGGVGPHSWRRSQSAVGAPQLFMRVATLYFVTDVRCPGVSPAGIAFKISSPRL
jgi:hypothetical protein